jgi:hypothetical protein
MKYFAFIILYISLALTPFASLSQTKAVTENGKDIIIYSDGTWEYQKTIKESKTNYIFLNDKQLEAGEKTPIHGAYKNLLSESYTYDDEVTYLQIAKDDQKTLMIFWQEKKFFPVYTWQGTVKIYLEDNSIITLYDRGLNGKNTIKGSSMGDDLNRSFNIYYLSVQDRQKLKNSDIAKVVYADDEGRDGTQILNLSINADTAKKQLYSLGR